MNTKHSFWNRLFAALLLAVMLVTQTATAFAVEDSPEPTEPSMVQAQDSDTGTEEAGEGTDTPEGGSLSEGPETALQTVSSLEELLQAIEQAEAGATIGIGCEIVCPDGTVLGDTYKRVTLQRTAPEGHISTYSPDGTGNVIIQAIDFDGGNVEATTPFVQASISTAYSECHFSDCTAGAVEADNGDQNFGYCVFERNTAQYGAHIRMNGGSANLFNCVLGRGTATIRGGAIACYTDQEVTLEKCSIWENTAAQHGGAIWNRGKLTITQSTIHNNTVNGEPDDIVNEYSGQLALMDDYDALVALYATYGLIPNKWAVDTFIDESAEKPNMVFSMSFAANDPEPSPEPEPEPTPTPDPEPKIIYRTRTVEKLVKEPEVEPATITNRKAVLKAPDSLFWTGYEIGHGGAGGTVTRADFAALMLSMMDDESRERYYTETAPFDDVAPGVWYAPAIGTATNAGFMLGCGLGVFQPERNLTWGELLTVFSRFTEEGTPPEIYTGNHWAKDAINTAISLEWISAGIDPGQTVTTGDLAGFVQTVFKWAEKS